MNQLRFLDSIHKNAPKNKWGWSFHEISKYVLETNGIAWTAINAKTGRSVRLNTVIETHNRENVT